MSRTLYTVDAFTDRPFRGNPAGVCVLERPAQEEWMQLVAREMNLAETAFLVPGDDGFALRWFTPAVEVDLCGHATLASAHTLWETGALGPSETARFQTKSGVLTAERKDGRIEMNFPAERAQPLEAPPGLLEALGVTPIWTGRNRIDFLVEVESEEIVRGVQPDSGLLRQLDARGAIVTARSDNPQYDFVSRCFYPAVGIDEDPVTGSAHCGLGPYWAEKLGKSDLIGYQASARGGVVWVRPQGDRVWLGGNAVTMMRLELLDDGQ
jgi:PhzF family phenazine biosynthesis protein